MKVLIACEESQEVCKAFRARWHEAYSCDLIEPSGGHPEWHILGDALKALEGGQVVTMDGVTHDVGKWDLLIAHPPCTYLTKAGGNRLVIDGKIQAERYKNGCDARDFFMKFWNAPVDKIAIENPKKWLELFGGADAEGAALGYQAAPFKVSDRCCYYLKEKPCNDWARDHNSVPYMGLMASEGERREKSLKMHGCNYFGKTTTRSAPFAIFDRQDILQLALDLNVPIPAEYGEIAKDRDGKLYTTKAQRTGCTMCGFGIHVEGRPHRFDVLRETNPKEWEFWMKHVCRDENGNWYGWGRVLDYIGIGWEDVPEQAVQMHIDDLIGGKL